MITKLPVGGSPIFDAYISQKDTFDLAIDTAVAESASKMTTKQLSRLFSTNSFPVLENKAA